MERRTKKIVRYARKQKCQLNDFARVVDFLYNAFTQMLYMLQ